MIHRPERDERDFCPDRDSSSSFFFFFFFVRSDRNSGSSNVGCCTLEVLHRAVDLLPHWCVRNSGSSDVCCCTLEVIHRAVDLLPHRWVSRPNFCFQIMVSLTVLQEVFHRHGRCTAVARRRLFNAKFREHDMVSESSMSSPLSYHDHLILLESW